MAKGVKPNAEVAVKPLSEGKPKEPTPQRQLPRESQEETGSNTPGLAFTLFGWTIPCKNSFYTLFGGPLSSPKKRVPKRTLISCTAGPKQIPRLLIC